MDTTAIDTNPQINDCDALLSGAVDMRSHIDRVRKLSPNLADQITRTWESDVKATQNIMFRFTAAKLILNGLADGEARRLVNQAGMKALTKLFSGEIEMPDSIKKALDARGVPI